MNVLAHKNEELQELCDDLALADIVCEKCRSVLKRTSRHICINNPRLIELGEGIDDVMDTTLHSSCVVRLLIHYSELALTQPFPLQIT